MTQRTDPGRPVRAAGDEGDDLGELLSGYGRGSAKFTGTDDALFERWLLFGHVINPGDAGLRGPSSPTSSAPRSGRWT